MQPSKWILPIIVISQFLCTTLWFAGNGVMHDLVSAFDLESNSLGHLTASVQFGFIIGTLVFAILTVADRFSPSKVFLVSALLGALCNLGIIWEGHNLMSLLSLRFFTGFFLAGIYPVGMKIASDHYDKGLGKSLGFLVGALVLGTAFPHILKDLLQDFSWQYVIVATSLLAALGGFLMVLLVPDGPYRYVSQGVQLSAFMTVFKDRTFRSAAFGYFGHMWELYAFWAFVPIIITTYNDLHHIQESNVSLWSFAIIGVGAIACVLGGYISQKRGVKRTAFTALLLSCICCLASPLLFLFANKIVFIIYLFFWGMVVIADSPLFSTLVAQNAPPQIKGTALTIVNCIGFAITIISIQLLTFLHDGTDTLWIYVVLAIGPMLGLLALLKYK